MMWFVYEEHKSSDRSEDIKLIHTCQSSNWTRHDGYSFGQQTITDNQGTYNFFFEVDFIQAIPYDYVWYHLMYIFYIIIYNYVYACVTNTLYTYCMHI